MKSEQKSRCRAFTLLEIMVTLFVFSILVASVYTTWLLLLRTSTVAQGAAARAQRERIAVRTIEDSLTCLQSFQGSIQYYSFNVTNGDQPGLSFVARLPDIFPRNGRFDSNLRRLTFTVEPDQDSGARDLVLRQNEILKPVDPEEQADPLVLARNVKSFVVECWNTNELDWAQEWDNTNSVPPLIRVTLTLLDDKNSPDSAHTIIREIAPPSITVPTVVQTQRGGGGPIRFGPGGLNLNPHENPAGGGH